MADDIAVLTVGTAYESLGSGKSGFALNNRHEYAGLRIAISDSQPPDDHAAYMLAPPRDLVQHYDIPAGFTLYCRADSDSARVTFAFRGFD